MRGYDQAEVRSFLGEVAAVLESTQARLDEAVRKISTLESQMKEYQSIEKLLHETLAQARETGERNVEKARAEAAAMIRDAETKASEIVDTARSQLTAIKEQIIVLNAKRDSITSRLSSLLSSELELVKSFTSDESNAPRNGGTDGGSRSTNPEIEDIVRNIDTVEKP